MKELSADAHYLEVIAAIEDQLEKQRHLEFPITVLSPLIPYDGKPDVEEYIDSGVVTLALQNEVANSAV